MKATKVDIYNLPKEPVYFYEDSRPKIGRLFNKYGIVCNMRGNEVKSYIIEADMIKAFALGEEK